RDAASLMICNLRSMAATAIGFERNASKSMPDVNCSIMAIASLISLNQRCRGELKDKDRLAFGSFRYLRPKHLPIRQIGPNAKNIRQAILQVDPPDERQFQSTVEIHDDVYI